MWEFVPITLVSDHVVTEVLESVSDVLSESGVTAETMWDRVRRARRGEFPATLEFVMHNGRGVGWTGVIPHSNGLERLFETTVYLAAELRGQGLSALLLDRQVKLARELLESERANLVCSSINSLNSTSLIAHAKFFEHRGWEARWSVHYDVVRERVSCVLSWPTSF